MSVFGHLRIIVLCSMFFTSSAFARSNIETAAQWGLLGSWMASCRQPASRKNIRATFIARQEHLFQDRDAGDFHDSRPILATKILPDGSIELLIDFGSRASPATRRFAIMKGDDGRIRAMSNRDEITGEYFVRNGKLVSNGVILPWQTRCK